MLLDRFILLNLNTIEDKKSARKARGGRGHPYDISPWRNWVSVCGANPLLWLLPGAHSLMKITWSAECSAVYSTPGDGTSWETAVELPDAADEDTEALTADQVK